MTPWLRFWFPHADHDDAARQPVTRDDALWTPQAIAATQRELWRHAAQATHDWWTYWRALWPALPVQPMAGMLQPPPQAPDADGETDAAAAPAAERRSPGGRGGAARRERRSGSAVRRPRSGARGR